jgi:hypothetical protein
LFLDRELAEKGDQEEEEGWRRKGRKMARVSGISICWGLKGRREGIMLSVWWLQ